MSMAIGHLDLEEHHKRIRKMTDDQLLRHGKSARELVENDKNPLPVFVLQLKEARAEWRRRHPKDQVRTRS